MKRLALGLVVLTCLAVSAAETYQKPPKEILDVLHAPATPQTSINTTKTHFLMIERNLYPTIGEVAAPMLRIAGLRLNPSTNGPHSAPSGRSLTLKKIEDGSEAKIAVPPNARLGSPEWSPDGKHFTITNTTATGIELYIGSIGSSALRKIPGVLLNDTVGDEVGWLAGSTTLLAKVIPAGRGPAPKPPAAPSGPNVQESAGRSGPVRTNQDMLKSPYDEQLFDYYCTSQLVSIDAVTGKVTPIGKPAIFGTSTASPDGKHILISRVMKPYSYLHPWNAFPREMEVWDRSGKVVYKIGSFPLEDNIPIGGVSAGIRNVSWRPTEGSTLTWWEALDGGNPRAKVPHRDKFMMLRAPFNVAATEVLRTEHRAGGGGGGGRGAGGPVIYGEGGLIFVSDFDRDKRWRRTYRRFIDDPSAEPKLVWSLNQQDRYNNPGTPFMKRLPNGYSILHQHGDYIFLTGNGASPDGDRPFLDRLNIKTWQTERLFRAGKEGYEQVIGLLAEDGSKFLTSKESPTEPANFYVRTAGSDQARALTNFKDPTPQLRKIQRQMVKYKRADGVDLSFELYLPPDYKPGTRLPTILYAYPTEFTDADVAGQIGGSTQRFVQPRGASHLLLVLAGYAILNNATIPIVGDPETVNNTYVEQLTASAKAAIDKAVEMGVTDPQRVGCTGHSYGGFMTANLLAHTDLFRTGVARSGAYNRTLTPFGFQNEQRTFWQARDVYMKMSPFTYADKINEPILLIHGEADNNQGTFPIQSERLYMAVRGNGGTVRLVMLPSESHGYGAKESIEHVLWETVTWFDKYLKNAKALSSSR